MGLRQFCDPCIIQEHGYNSLPCKLNISIPGIPYSGDRAVKNFWVQNLSQNGMHHKSASGKLRYNLHQQQSYYFYQVCTWFGNETFHKIVERMLYDPSYPTYFGVLHSVYMEDEAVAAWMSLPCVTICGFAYLAAYVCIFHTVSYILSISF